MKTTRPPATTTGRFQAGWALVTTLKRLSYQWHNLLAAGLGVLLAAVIGSSIPLYSSAVGHIGLQQTLANAEPAISHVALRTGQTRLSQARATELDLAVRQVYDQNLRPWITEIIRWQETLPVQPTLNGALIPETRLRLGHYANWAQHAVLEAGTMPSATPPAGVDVEAVASIELAQALLLNPGDVLVLTESRASSLPIHVRISGFIDARDSEDPYWPQAQPPIHLADPVSQWRVQGTLLVEEQAFFDLATTSLPETTSNLGWRLLVRHQAITLESIPAVIEALQTAVESVNQIGAGYMSVESGLVPLLNRFQQEAALLAAPFSLLIIQIGALTLYFLLTTAELVRQQDRREIALMRSRGGFTNQVWALRALEAFLVSAAAVTAAPLIARFGLRQLGAMGVLSGLDSGTIPLRLNATVWGYSIASGLTSWVVLMLTLRPVLRAPLVTAGGAWERPERRAWWQRAFLDVALLVLGGVALWQLRSYGSILVQNQAGRILADPLLLLTPSLLMVAVGSLLLRLFAPAMGLLAAAMARRNGLDTLLAVWHVSRRPVHYSRIALLLALAIGLGWFATGFDATVERSRVDRAGYAVGAEMRLTSVDTLQGRLRTLPEDEYSILGGVKHASVAFRTRFDASTRTTGSLPGELLAVDPASFASAAYWRTDLGVLALPGSGLSAPSAAGRALTPDLARVGLWAAVPGTDPRDLVNRTKLYIRVMDSAGTLANIPLRYSFAEMVTLSNIPDGPYSPAPVKEPTGWVYMVGDLTETGRPLHEPLYLRSIHWTYRSPTSGGGQGILTLAELTLYDQTLVSHSVPWLATTAGWQFQHDGLSVATGNVVTRPSRKKAELATTVSWSQTGRTASMGLILDASPAGTLPAIVSSSFLQGNGITGRVPFFVNLMNTRLRFQVVGVMDYYPSLYADARPFLVTDRDLLLYALNLLPSAAVYPNEIWLQLEDPNSAAAVLEALNRPGDGYAVKDVLQARDLQRQMQNNPLTIGLTGLFFIAFAVALILSAVSLLSYVSLTAQARRVEFSILQSLGHSAQRLLLSLALEQSLVLGTAAGLGAVLGAMLSGQILPFLSVTEGGQLIVPPFRIMTGTDLLARYALIMLAVFAVLLLASLWLLRSLPLARTLRLGDE